ncbi:MAG TPA: acyltransferase family protein [Devosia sp.]|nr:acyltransferase family protein [Devosia sp.]
MSGHTNRLDWVDSAKGISIILVVMMYSVFNVGQDAEGVGLFHYIIGFATPFRMPEFFLISGLFVDQVLSRTWRAYADRRVVHYLYFYAIWAVIHIVLKIGILSAAPKEAAVDLLYAIVEPYGVLWFIYLLAAFSAATKLMYDLRAPKWAVWAFGAAFQMAHVQTGSYLVDQFCAYFVYFYSGYIFAPRIFRLVDFALGHKPLALGGLAIYAVVNVALVFSPGFAVLPNEIQLGWAGLPGVRLTLAIAGSLALCVTAGLITGPRVTGWLRWLGEHSIVVYLVFVLPMSFIRIALGKLGLIDDVTLSSFIVMTGSIVASVALYLAVQWVGRGKFLFERPAWAHIPGTKGSRSYAPSGAVPAE